MFTLKSLSLSGFKSIRETNPPLHFGRLTVIVGANGAGKSNLLSFFKLLNQLTRGTLRKHIAQEGGPEALLHKGRKRTQQIRAALEWISEPGFGHTHLYQFALSLAKGKEQSLFFEEETLDSRVPGGDYGILKPLSFGVGHAESGLAASEWNGTFVVAGAKQVLSEFRFYQFHDTSQNSALRIGRCESHLVHPFRGDGSNLPAVLWDLHQNFPREYQLLLQTIRLVAPFFKDFVLKEEPGKAPVPDIQLSWTEDGDYEQGMHALSDGTLRFIALATLLSLPEGRMPKGALLIDEPELGLHPRAMSVLAALIRVASSRVQIICSTQSPDLLSEFEPGQVLVAEREGGSSVFKPVNEQSLKVWLEDEFSLGEIWKKNLIGGRPRRD